MSRPFTLGVLTPFIGGWYFGGLLSGITRVTNRNDAAMVAVHTLDAGTEQGEVTDPPSTGNHIATDHADGFIVIINAARADYLAQLRDSGTPVVTLSHDYPGLGCPLVLPDNTTGIQEAVAHLIEHGHRRIAFVGYLGADDVRLRHHGYSQALLDHGITPDPGLVFRAPDNMSEGGEEAARSMIAAGLPSTAVITGTDANAIGMMRVLTAAGYRIPADQAIIGFDDIQAASYCNPRLSSVKQPVEELGATAAEMLLHQLRTGRAAAGQRQYVDTKLVVRESCGCVGGAPETQLPPDLATMLTGPMSPDARHDLVRDLSGTRPEELLGIAHQVRETARNALGSLGFDAPARQHAVTNVGELILSLMEAQGRAQYADSDFLQQSAGMQYEVSFGLLRSYEEDPRGLGWLRRTPVWAGCLALWRHPGEPSGPGRSLEVVGTFCQDDDAMVDHREPLAGLVGSTVPVAAFPPPELLDLARRHPQRALFVAPVKVDDNDWGLLAVIDGIGSRVSSGREPLNQWAALLTVALQHQAVLGALRIQEERFRIAALYDHLTGLPNRALFVQRLGEAVQRCGGPSGSRFGVLFLDLDGFKLVNDSLGHDAGDRLLVQVAGRISEQLRVCDTAARFGGDEFLLLVEDVDEPGTLEEIADRLQTVLSQPYHLEGHDETVVVGASIGITVGTSRYRNPEDVLRDADIAMYTAKSRRKGSYAIFDEAMHTRVVDRLRIETDLRAALEKREFELYYQPIVELRTGRVQSFEALLRWRHPGRGVLAPDRFLPVAEEADLMQPIGQWVLEESCRQLATWQREADRPEPAHLAINLSDREFWGPGLIDNIAACLAVHDLPHGSLAVEITEGVLLRDAGEARRILDRLHALGCELHIDDFGTGFSSLEALLKLPIDALKIDRSFVAGLGHDPKSEELVKTILRMGRNLDLDLIAEGIETEEQRRMLFDLGCTYGQGYLFARPATPEVAITMITSTAAV
ncbi:EAL domain-containing protein [Actinoplanes sp. GCM10030250]|uniref:EAL domain-containing protein n=1 Tax=Actinoplanes sp. GCM10030250 TaxID=3273376 RepID=UPI003607072D